MEEEKNKKEIIEKLKKRKIIKTITAFTGVSFPLFVILSIIFAAAIASLLPIFLITTMVGGTTAYGDNAEDLPEELTIKGVDTWDDDAKKIFEVLEGEKNIYDKGFKDYNVEDILKYKNTNLDVGTPVATIHYMGTVNLTVFDEDYLETIFSDGSSSLSYDEEKHVENKHTRDFYRQAGEVDGATFRMYPGNRMLLGNLVGNNIKFSVVPYEIYEDGTDNSQKVYGDWNYLAKLTASTEDDAKGNYNARSSENVDNAIANITSAINFGDGKCKSENIDPWLHENYCYDTESLYGEIFGENFDITKKTIETYLEEEFEKFDGEHNAKVPTGGTVLRDGHYYITVEVTKQIDYNKYKQYLKSVYIPFYYINCDTCGDRDASLEVKESKSQSILDEIMQLTNSFKTYNDEELISDDNGNGGSSEGTIGNVTGNRPSTNLGQQFGSGTWFNGSYVELPKYFYSQLIVPLTGKASPFLESCSKYYTDQRSSNYYCGTYHSRHNGVDILSNLPAEEAVIVAPADGIVESCRFDSYGPWLSISHNLVDDNGNLVKVNSYYRHWLDINGNRSCETFTQGMIVKQGQPLALESGQGGDISYGRHLHFGMQASNGTVYNVENYLISKGVTTGSITSNCEQVRKNCDRIIGVR